MGCIFKAECEPLHIEARAALRAHLGVKLPVETKAPRPAKEKPDYRDQSEAALALPVKVQALLNRLDRGGFDVINKLRAGENPFAEGLPFMKVAAHLLLGFAKHNQGLDRDLLATAFVKKLGWQEDTAQSHARMAIQALTHIGAVENQQGRIFLRRQQ